MEQMKKRKTLSYIVSPLVLEAAGGITAYLCREGFDSFQKYVPKSSLTPPGIVFAIAWVILYALLGISFARLLLAESKEKCLPILLFVIQALINFGWVFVFFGRGKYGLALLWLLVLLFLVLWEILFQKDIDKISAILLLPYALWLAFAGYLNLCTWLLNR